MLASNVQLVSAGSPEFNCKTVSGFDAACCIELEKPLVQEVFRITVDPSGVSGSTKTLTVGWGPNTLIVWNLGEGIFSGGGGGDDVDGLGDGDDVGGLGDGDDVDGLGDGDDVDGLGDGDDVDGLGDGDGRVGTIFNTPGLDFSEDAEDEPEQSATTVISYADDGFKLSKSTCVPVTDTVFTTPVGDLSRTLYPVTSQVDDVGGDGDGDGDDVDGLGDGDDVGGDGDDVGGLG